MRRLIWPIQKQIKSLFPGDGMNIKVLLEHRSFALDKSLPLPQVVISCAETYEARSKVAEKCKEKSVKFIDAGISFQQGHVQVSLVHHLG